MASQILLVKEYQDSIFFIKDTNRLMKYNLITKKYYLVFKAAIIYEYHCFNSDLVIHFLDNTSQPCIFWNNKIDKSKQFTIDCHGTSEPLVINSKLHIVVNGYHEMHIYSFEGLIKTTNHRWFRVSPDGKRIMRCYGLDVYIADVAELDSLYEDLKVHKQLLRLGYTECEMWICSNFLISFSFCTNKSHTLQNLETGAICKLSEADYCRIFVLGDYLLVMFYNKYIIYDVKTLNLLTRIVTDINIISSNNLLNVLIADDFQCYVIRNGCFKKAHVGEYYSDELTSNRIKIIMDIVLAVIELPLDIVYCELYKSIICMLVSYF